MPYGDDDNDEKRAGDVAPEGKRVTGRSEQESRRRRAGLQGVRAAAGAGCQGRVRRRRMLSKLRCVQRWWMMDER